MREEGTVIHGTVRAAQVCKRFTLVPVGVLEAKRKGVSSVSPPQPAHQLYDYSANRRD